MKEIVKNVLIMIGMMSVAGFLIYYLADTSVRSRLVYEEASFCKNAIKHGLNVPTCKAPTPM